MIVQHKNPAVALGSVQDAANADRTQRPVATSTAKPPEPGSPEDVDEHEHEHEEDEVEVEAEPGDHDQGPDEDESDSEASHGSGQGTGTDTEVEELLRDVSDHKDNLPRLTSHGFPLFWNIAAKEYDLIKLPVNHPRSKFNYVVVPGSRSKEDALSAYKAIPYFNRRKQAFRKAFREYETALMARKQERRAHRERKNKKRKNRTDKRQKKKKKKKTTKKQQKRQNAGRAEKPSSSEDCSESETGMHAMDRFVRRIQDEKKRHLQMIATSLRDIDTRLKAINDEANDLQSRRTKLEEEQLKLQNYKV